MDRPALIAAFRAQYPGADPDAIERAADLKFGQRVEIPAAPQPKGDGMNKTERRRAVELAALQRAGAIRTWHFNAVTLKLADDCRFTPDFLIEHIDGRLEFEEIKGFWRDDARVKIKVAARLFPVFTFTALRARKVRDGGGWAKEAF